LPKTKGSFREIKQAKAKADIRDPDVRINNLYFKINNKKAEDNKPSFVSTRIIYLEYGSLRISSFL